MNRRLLSLTVAGMEFCWLYGFLLLWSQRTSEPSLPVAGLFTFYVLGFGFHAYARRLGRKGMRLQVLSWSAYGVFLLLLAKIHLFESWSFLSGRWVLPFFQGIVQWERFPSQELVMTGAGTLMWWCGGRLEKTNPDHALFLSEFQFGAAMLLIVFYVDGQWGMNISGLFPLTLGFFLFALLGLALAHAQSTGGWLFGAHRGRWLGLLVMVLCLVMTGGILLGSLLRPDLLKLLLELLKAVWVFVSDLIAKVLSFLFSLFPVPEPHGIKVPPPQISPMDRDPSFLVKLFRIPEAIRRVGEVMVGCLWIILFLIALWRVSSSILAWLTRKVVGLEGVEVEPLSGAFLEDLRALARFMLRKLAGLGRWIGRITGWAGLSAAVQPEVATARGIYRKVLRWGAQKGCPRGRAQTPREYLVFLVEAFPEVRWELAFITHQYVQARYSPWLPAGKDLDKLGAIWKRLKGFRFKKGKGH